MLARGQSALTEEAYQGRSCAAAEPLLLGLIPLLAAAFDDSAFVMVTLSDLDYRC